MFNASDRSVPYAGGKIAGVGERYYLYINGTALAALQRLCLKSKSRETAQYYSQQR
jgi:hypothetical protein